jgi:putative ABC transport system permease protein
MFDRTLAQVRHAARGLVRAPLLTLVATVSLAIGIGANTAVFTVANAVLFAPAPGIDRFDRLVDIGRTTRGTGFDELSYPTYTDLRDRATTLAGVIALRPEPRPLSVGTVGDAVLAYGLLVSANYFDVLGVRPAAGSFFHGRDEHPGTPFRQAVLSHAFWQSRFAGDAAVVGTTIVLNGDTYSVAGVAAAGFQGTTIVSPDVWLPLTALAHTTPTEDLLRSRGSLWLQLSGRLAPGATIDQARAEMTALSRGLADASPDACQGCGLAVAPSRRMPPDVSIGPFFAMLMSLVGVVLVVTCANLGGLLVSRAGTRARELAVRLALGASGGSLVAMFLVESVVLFLPGAALALVVAGVATHLIESLTPRLPMPVAAGLVFDWRVLTFTAGVTFAMALVTGLAPAWHATRGDLIGDLKRDASAPRRHWLRRVFVAAQLAFCLVSMALAGLLLRGLRATTTINPGFQVDRIDVASVDLSLAGYDNGRAAPAIEGLRARLAALPGIESVGVAAVVPLTYEVLRLDPLRRAGDPASASLLEQTDVNVISPEYLPTIGVRIVRGRNFSARDRSGAPRVAVVNERLARAAWPGLEPIGRLLEMGDFRAGQEKSVERLEVVGVAADAKYGSIGETPIQFIYVPISQQPWARPFFFVKRSASASSGTPSEASVRQTLRAFDQRLPLLAFAPLQQYADTGLLPQRIAASIAGSLGALALALGAIGLYGLTAFLVSSRSREIGVRVALGAGHAHIMRLVVGEGMRLAAVGGAIGLCLSVGAARLLSSVLFGVSALDPLAFGAAVLAITGVTLIATYVPARRAAAVDPLVALRVD